MDLRLTLLFVITTLGSSFWQLSLASSAPNSPTAPQASPNSSLNRASRTARSARESSIAYKANYITAIEDSTCEPSGFFVSSSDQNYAIVSPNLSACGWRSISVNGDKIFAVRQSNNLTLNTNFNSLPITERDIIAELRANFTHNLAGLKFAFYTSGSAFSPSISRATKTNHQLAATNVWKNPNVYSNYNGNSNSEARQMQVQPNSRRTRSTPRNTGVPMLSSAVKSKSRTLDNSVAAFQCSDYASNTNYYNTAMDSPLNSSLAGDIYFFDFGCNVLDVYSASVSVRRQADYSVVYRDHRYFTISRPDFPLSINRFFLIDDMVIIVYNDGLVVAKQSWMLNEKELNMIVRARNDLRQIKAWQQRTAVRFNKLSQPKQEQDVDSKREFKKDSTIGAKTTESVGGLELNKSIELKKDVNLR